MNILISFHEGERNHIQQGEKLHKNKRRKTNYIWWRKIGEKMHKPKKRKKRIIFGGEKYGKNCIGRTKKEEIELYLVEKKLGSLAAISLSVPVNLAICRDTSVSNEIYRLFQKYLLSMPKVLSRFYAEIMLVKSYQKNCFEEKNIFSV